MKSRSVLFVAGLVALGSLVGISLSLRETGGSLTALTSINILPEAQPIDSASGDSANVSIDPSVRAHSTNDVAQQASIAEGTSTRPQDSGALDLEVPFLIRTSEWHHPATGIQRTIVTRELERGENYSYLETDVDFDELPSLNARHDFSDSKSLKVFFTLAGMIDELVWRRGFSAYFVWAPPEKIGYYVFMTHDADMPLENLLGDMYSDEAQAYFDSIGYVPTLTAPGRP